jgi:hypothetical protein
MIEHKKQKPHLSMKLFKAVENRGVEPLTFPLQRDALPTSWMIEHKKQKPHLSMKLFKAVENRGVEPLTSCMPCKRSSQLS